MRRAMVTAIAIAAAMWVGACGGKAPGPSSGKSALDAAAGQYVRLVLAVGRHDSSYVDAYYGPPEWKTEAAAGAPVPVAELIARTRALLDDVAKTDGPADRRRYLEKQLIAVEAFLRRLSGESMTLAEECSLFYDADPPRHDVAGFAAAQAELERLLPGPGPLGPKLEALRRAVYVPRERLAATVDSALAIARRATAPLVTLPAGERFDAFLVDDKPWGAYNWYLGGYRSRIELNTDLPVELNSLLGTMCHEGYPGHHVYNALIEERLVKGKGWIEFTIYPLYSPQSLIAEGTANAGIDLLFDDAGRRRALEELAAVAGVPPEAVVALDRVRVARRPLRYVGGEAARLLLDEGRPDDEVAAFLMKWGLSNERRARQSIRFARAYRSYLFNYTLGEDIVEAWIGDGPDRRERFFDLLERPVVPSDLRR